MNMYLCSMNDYTVSSMSILCLWNIQLIYTCIIHVMLHTLPFVPTLPLEVQCTTRSTMNMYLCSMYDYAVSSMSILCLWNIQLTFDWVGIEPHGASA